MSERGVERNENTSISSGVTDTNAISQGTFDAGATYRLELQCYHLAGKSERNNNSHNNNDHDA